MGEVSGAVAGDASDLRGREAESARLQNAMEAAARGSGTCVVITGPAGMGKTTLARWVVDLSVDRDFAIYRARAWEAVDTPAFWPWTQVVRRLREDLRREDIHVDAAVAEQLAKLEAGGGGGMGRDTSVHTQNRFALFDAITELIRLAQSDGRKVLVVMEDVHATDESSLLLLQFAAQELEGTRVLFVATADTDELAKRPTHSRLLEDVGRVGTSLVLQGLDRSAMLGLYESVAGQTAPEAVIAALEKITEGNPLFIVEAAKALSREGDLHRPDHSTGFRVPEGLRGMIRRRIDPLHPDTTELLSIASVLGVEFDISVLQSVAGLDLEEILRRLQAAVDESLLRETSALGRYGFRHILIRETLYEDLTASKRMRLHRSVAEALEGSFEGELDAHAAELAHHWFKAAQAGDAVKALQYITRAAELAVAREAHEEAVRLYERALKVAARLGDDTRTASVRVALADLGSHPERSSDTEPGLFRREGEYWTIRFQGTEVRLKDRLGLRYLARLLFAPGQEIHVLDLIRDEQNDPGIAVPAGSTQADGLSIGRSTDLGPVLDEEAKLRYRRRLEDLRDEVEEAEAYNDPERAAYAREEMDLLAQELAGAMGLGGRDRRLGSGSERARVSVTKAVKQALLKIKKEHPGLGRHLSHSVKTGTYCRYEPAPGLTMTWEK